MPWRLCLLGVIVSAGASGASAAPTDSIWWAMTAFGDNGLVTVQDSSAIAYPNAVAVAPDGSVLVAGNAGVAVGGSILGYLDDGSLDQSFGTNGTATVAGFTASSVVALRDGGIVAAGARGDDVAAVRLRKGGTPDPSFGTAGMTSWHPAPLSAAVALASRRNGAVDVAVLGTFPGVNVGQDTWKGGRIQRLTATGRLWRQAD